MVTGSVAVIVYGEPRLTHDVDLVAVLDRKSIDRFPEAFPTKEFYCPPVEEIRLEAEREQRGHFNLIHHETGFKADVYLAGQDPLHAWAFERTRQIEVDTERIVMAPPEYVILRKLEFFREGGSEKHLRDIRSMLATSPGLIRRDDLEKLVAERGLQEAWSRVAQGR